MDNLDGPSLGHMRNNYLNTSACGETYISKNVHIKSS